MSWEIVCADVLDWTEEYDGPKFHAMLCDPPYGLEFMGKEWDSFKGDAWLTGAGFSKPGIGERRTEWPSYGTTAPFGGANPTCARCGGRLRGAKKCDCDEPDWRVKGEKVTAQQKYPTAQTLAYQAAMTTYFAALAQHLHPGAWVMAFASSRGWHRLAVAIEDAGMIVQPSVFGWATGQSFPKATRIDTAIDRRAGKLEDREVIGTWKPTGTARPAKGKKGHHAKMTTAAMDDIDYDDVELDITAPATALARAWVGHRYGGQVLKNALEPIICAQKPWTDPRLDCIVETGAGALWVDGGRIAGPKGDGVWGSSQKGSNPGQHGTMGKGWDNDYRTQQCQQGRWPANFTLTHSPLDNGDGCHESCVVRRLGEQSGERPSGGKNGAGNVSIWGGDDSRQGGHMKPSTGTAARFFQQSDWSYEIAERLALADPVRYQAKSARAEREGGLFGVIPCAQCGGLDTETHVNEHGRTVTCRRCDHPTVKPLSLNIWLATLLLPPPEYAPRRLLVPFCGSGSEAIGALLAGWDEVVMVDNNAEYCEIAEARTRWWQGWSQRAGATEPKEILKAAKDQPVPEEKRQLELLPPGERP